MVTFHGVVLLYAHMSHGDNDELGLQDEDDSMVENDEKHDMEIPDVFVLPLLLILFVMPLWILHGFCLECTRWLRGVFDQQSQRRTSDRTNTVLLRTLPGYAQHEATDGIVMERLTFVRW